MPDSKKNEKKCLAQAGFSSNSEKQTRSRSKLDDEIPETCPKKYIEDTLSLANIKTPVGNMQIDMSSMQSDIREIKTMFADLKGTMIAMSSETAEIKSTIDSLSDEKNKLVEDGISKDKKISAVEEKISELEQQMLGNNVEIVNAPTIKSSLETVIDIAAAVNMQIEKNEIESVYHTKNKKKLVVKFFSKNTKLSLMRKIRDIKPTTNKIYNDGSNANKRIFINDELTAFNRNLLWLAETRGKSSNWKYVWVKDGRILAKKNDDTRSIHIRRESDLNFNE